MSRSLLGGLIWLSLLGSCQQPTSDASVPEETQTRPARPGVLPSTSRAFELLQKTPRQNYENPIDIADSLRAEFRLQEALELYNQVLAKDPTNYESLWKKSCTISEMGFLITNLQIKEAYYTEALHLAKKALGSRPDGLGAHFAMALVLARMESVVDDHRKITFAVKMKRHAETVLRMDSTYHYAWYLLGSWSYDFAGLGPSDHSVAKKLFGTDEVENATYQHALEYFTKALSYDPENVMYNYHAAMAHIQIGQEDQAVGFLQTAMQEPIDAKKEEEFIRKFKLMISGQAAPAL